jgi:hypothetical protein
MFCNTLYLVVDSIKAFFRKLITGKTYDRTSYEKRFPVESICMYAAKVMKDHLSYCENNSHAPIIYDPVREQKIQKGEIPDGLRSDDRKILCDIINAFEIGSLPHPDCDNYWSRLRKQKEKELSREDFETFDKSLEAKRSHGLYLFKKYFEDIGDD